MKKRFLIINLGWEQRPLIEKIVARREFDLFGVHHSNDPSLPPVFQDVFVTDLRDLAGILDYAGKIKPNYVISDGCDYSLIAQAAIAEKLDLPGPSLHGAQLSNNKFLQREFSKGKGILTPNYELCLNTKSAENFAEKNGYPIILKPTDNRGSIGVVKVNGSSELKESFFIAMSNSHSRCVLAEQFIQGQQITVDGYVFPRSGCRSVALGSKLMSKNDTQVALGIYYPGNIDTSLYYAALQHNADVNEKLGYAFGMTHTEYIIKDNQLYLIESANRGGGVFTSALVAPAVSNIDLLAQYIADCMGEVFNMYQDPERNSVALQFFSFRPGLIKSVHGWEKLSNDPNVIKAELWVKPGEKIGEITNDANRHGYLIARGSSTEVNSLISNVELDYA